MRVAPVQMLNVHWTGKQIDICSLPYPPYSREALQSEIRQIHQRLDRFFHLYEWHWLGKRPVCLREQSRHWKM
jgi:hypothetical protein